MKSIQAIIFDCDGTLVDSEGAHFFCWRQAVRKWGGDLTLEEYKHLVGQSGETISRLLAHQVHRDCAEELFAYKRELFYAELSKGLPSIAGTVEFVHRLVKEKKRLGLKLGLASATVAREISLNLKHLGLENAFDVVLSGHSDLAEYQDPEGVNKPKPYIYLHAAKKLGAKPSECVVIEDSHTGVVSAIRAGCFTVAIPTVFSEHQDFSMASLQIASLSGWSVERFMTLVLSEHYNQ